MSAIDCLYPRVVAVHSVGSATKKDGTPGHKVDFNPFLGNIRPDHHGEVPNVFTVPCGKCYNCRKKQAYAWSLRIQMEQKLYDPDQVCFLTLTYDASCVPDQLDHTHAQQFLHNLRTILKREEDAKLRYFMCGEYGGRNGRPHFHLILYGFDFFKKGRIFEKAPSGSYLYTHQYIDRAWHRGIATFGELTAASAMYVAQYTQKKLIDNDPFLDRKAPYIQMSRRPGIGQEYILTHAGKIQEDGGLYLNGNFVPVNRYMLKVLLKSGDLTLLDKAQIQLSAEENSIIDRELWDNTREGVYWHYVQSQAKAEMQNKRAAKLSKGDVF